MKMKHYTNITLQTPSLKKQKVQTILINWKIKNGNDFEKPKLQWVINGKESKEKHVQLEKKKKTK